MVKKTGWIVCALLGMALLGAGCGNAEKEATEAAISAAQAAINAGESEAQKYVPDQLQAAQTALQSAKDSFAKGDYPAALKAAQEATNQASEMVTAAAAKKEEWTKDWAELSASIPKTLDKVKYKLDAYSRGAHMPEGMDETRLADAKAQYEQLKQSWAEGLGAAAQGNLGEAMQKASGMKEPLAKLVEMLGVKL